tara:strand:- start:18566 stop:20350 length:1785 start_codon:yes stop_codon:yes gene_type:complete
MQTKDLLISKPSSYFLVSILFCFVALLYFGDTTWRMFDDFAPLKFIYEINSLKDFIKLFTIGWGSYPPIWGYFSLLSSIFKPIGIDFVNLVCFSLGFLSLAFSSFLTYAICLLIKLENKNTYTYNKPNYFIEIFSVTLNILNPEIILHSNSNMPYNLSTITIQLFILLIFSFVSKENYILVSNNNIYIKSRYIIFATLFSLLLTFNSTIIISSFILTFCIFINKNYFNISFKKNFKPIKLLNSYNSIFNIIENNYLKNFLYYIFLFLSFGYLSKLFRLIFLFKTKPGYWANGINDVYNLSNFLSDPLELLIRIIFNLQSIIMQAFYPYRNFQIEFSYLILVIFLVSFFIFFKRNILTKYFSIFSIFVLIISIVISINGSFIFAPSRHTIFLYPIFWIPIIIFIDQIIFKLNIKLSYNLFLSLLLFFSFLFGSFSSISQISYSKDENNQLIDLLKETDFFLSGIIDSESYDTWSDLSLQSSDKFKLVNQKSCSIEKIKNLKSYKVLAYSHVYPITSQRNPFSNHVNPLSSNRYPLTNNDLQFLREGNENCFLDNSQLSILKKIERFNSKGLEQNNLLYMGGSSLYAYLIKVVNLN